MQWKVPDIRILFTNILYMIYLVKWEDGHDKEERRGQQLATKLQKVSRDPRQSGNGWGPNCKKWAKIWDSSAMVQYQIAKVGKDRSQCDDAAEPKWATFATQMVLKVAPPLVWMSICMRVPRRLNGCWLAATRSLSEGATGCLSEGATSCLSQGATGCYTLLITGRYRVLHAAYHRVITTWACIDCSNCKVVKGQKLYIHCSGVVQSS